MTDRGVSMAGVTVPDFTEWEALSEEVQRQHWARAFEQFHTRKALGRCWKCDKAPHEANAECNVTGGI